MDAFTIVFVIFAVVILGLKFAYYKATGDKEGLKSTGDIFRRSILERDSNDFSPASVTNHYLYDDD